MNTKDQDLKWKLCDAYFKILNNSNQKLLNLEKLCLKAKVSYKEAKKSISEKSVNNIFFLKILINKLDAETLEELKTDLSDDTISSTYDKILEGLTLRFEKFLQYKTTFKTVSENPENKVENFFKLLQQNYSFMNNLLDLVENKQNCSLKTIKSIVLNILFIRGVEVFLKDKNNNLDSTIRFLDKYLKDIEDLGVFAGVINKKL